MAVLPYQSRFSIPSLKRLALFSEALAQFLKPGDVVALDGPLGAGKTTLTQHLLPVLGVQEPVSSPTFVLMNEYFSGLFPVAHVDLYRLGPERSGSLAQELTAIVDEGRSLLLVEWACYGDFLDSLINVQLSIQPELNESKDVPDLESGCEGRCIVLSSNRPLTDALLNFGEAG